MHNNEALIGLTLSDRYEILEKIGTGGMATVYKAHDNVLDRDVAIKMLRENFDSETEVVSNFIREARSSASLVHPNVVSVYDVSEYDGSNYMVMELVDGKTLKEYIKISKRLPWQEACNYAIQIGQGIQAAHERNIIHRDIKPQNIIMDSSNTLKVTDFGIAKAVEGEMTIAGGTAMGSVHYISPEQARGGYTDFRSDIYSLGVVLYEMLAGRVPFDGDDPVVVALMHIEEEAVNVKCVNMDVPSDLAYVTMRAMNREPSKRYQQMQDLLDDLRAVLADEHLPSREKEPLVDIGFDPDRDCQKASDKNSKTSKDINTRVREKGREKVVKKKAERNAIILAFATAIAFVLVVLGFLWPALFSKNVPNFTNMKIEEAQKAAQRKGFRIEIAEYTFSDVVPKDCVISQYPEAGKRIDKHETIKLYVSLGATGGAITVPNLIGYSVDEATAELEAIKLICKTEFRESDTEPGTIIEQFPSAGTHVNPADTVKIYVSRGPKVTMSPQTESESTPEPDSTEQPKSDDEVSGTPTAQPVDNSATSKMYSVKFPDDAGENVHVKIVANGNVLHDSMHSKIEGKVVQEISGTGAVKVQTYIDGVLVNEETLNF